MTTIAYKDGILAADTQLTTGNIKGLCRKIEIYPAGEVVAAAGLAVDGFAFQEWYHSEKKKKRPKFGKGFELFMIKVDGSTVFYEDDCIEMPMVDPIYSNGSGFAIAKAAMLMGLSSKEAVKLAGQVEINTNTLVDTYDTKTKRLTLARFPKYKA